MILSPWSPFGQTFDQLIEISRRLAIAGDLMSLNQIVAIEEFADLACNIVAPKIGVPINPVFPSYVGGIDMNEMDLLQGNATDVLGQTSFDIGT